MRKTTNISISTIEAAIRVLAYNEYFWEGFQPHHKDKKTVISLADSPYTWTEKQAKLALAILKRYHTLFQKYQIDLSDLLNNPIYENPFRIIDFVKSVDVYVDEELKKEIIELKFPYDEKIIRLIRCLKNYKTESLLPMSYDGESKKWIIPYTEVTCYYVTLIAVRYDFKILNTVLLDDYEEIKKEKILYKTPCIKFENKELSIVNGNENLVDWWNEYQKKNILHQFDVIKNLQIDSLIPKIDLTDNKLSEKIALSMKTDLWIDRTKYSKVDFLKALEELDMFPAIAPMSGLLENFKQVTEFEEWYEAFDKIGYDKNEIAWGVKLEDPPSIDNRRDDKNFFFAGTADYVYGEKTPMADRELMEDRWFNIVLESKASRYVDENTKIIIIRNRIPRTLIKSKVKVKCSFALQDTVFWPTSSESIKRMVDNLPKRLYYVSTKPSFETDIK
jgi:hypothetical protein